MYLIDDDDEIHIGIANGVWHTLSIDGALCSSDTMAQAKTHHNNSINNSNNKSNGKQNFQKQYRQRFTFNSHEHKSHVAEELIFLPPLLVQS